MLCGESDYDHSLCHFGGFFINFITVHSFLHFLEKHRQDGTFVFLTLHFFFNESIFFSQNCIPDGALNGAHGSGISTTVISLSGGLTWGFGPL